MKKLATFAGLMFIAPSVATAQLGLAQHALGSSGQAGRMQIAGRIILIAEPGPQVALGGTGVQSSLGGFVAYEDDNAPASKVAHVGSFAPYEGGASVADETFRHVGGFVAYEDDSSPAGTVANAGGLVAYGSSSASPSASTVREISGKRLVGRGFGARGTMGEIGGFVAYEDDNTPAGTVGQVGGFVAHGSSAASASLSLRDIDPVKLPKDRGFTPRGTMGAIGGFVAYEDDNTPASKVAQAGGMVAYEKAAASASTSQGRMREIGGAIARGKRDDPHARGTFGHVSVGPQAYGEQGELEPNTVEVTQVTLFGRSGANYALVMQPMGSANGPQILIAHGMLFGTDPGEGVRKLVLRVPVELGLFLIPLE